MRTADNNFSQEVAVWAENKDLLDGILDMIPAEALDSPEIDDMVKAFYVYPGSEVFTAWVATSSKIVLHERNLEGMTLTITFPLTRIRRVSQQNDRETVVLTLEFDADRLVFSGSATQADDGLLTLSGSSLHSGYTLSVEASDVDNVNKLVSFSKNLRSIL